MPNKLEKTFLDALSLSFGGYNEYDPRSTKKLIPIHKWFADIMEGKLGKKYKINSLGKNKEYTFNGKYYPKTLDIAIIKGDELKTTMSFKFVTSNYKQNANNYFENLLGETANIRRMNIGFAHFLVLRANTPYYDKNKGNLRGEQKKIEVLREKDLKKYINLFKDNDFPHKPEIIGIAIIDFDENGKCKFANLNRLDISDETKNILNDDFSISKFIKKFVALCDLKS